MDEIRVSYPTKNIWLYTGYTWEQIMYPIVTDDLNFERDYIIKARKELMEQYLLHSIIQMIEVITIFIKK